MIVSKRPVESGYAELTLGGVKLYSQTERLLTSGVDQIVNAIDDVTECHLLLIRQVLLSQVRQRLSFTLSNRVFGAVVGRMLKTEQLKVLLSLSPNSKLMRVLYNSRNTERLETIIQGVFKDAKDGVGITTSEVQDKYFKDQWAGYYMAQQICGNLAFSGLLYQVRQDMFKFPIEIERAIDSHRS